MSLFDRCVQRLTSRRPLPQLSSCHSFINRKKKKKRTEREGEERKKKKKKISISKSSGREKKKKKKQTNKKILFPSLASVKNRKKERGERRIKTPLALTCLTGWGVRGGNDKKRHIGWGRTGEKSKKKKHTHTRVNNTHTYTHKYSKWNEAYERN